MAARTLLHTPPLSIGRYALASRVVSGRYGSLYRARDTETDALAAVQLIPVDAQKDPGLFDRLQAEFALASSLEHPNVLRLFDFGRESGYWYVATEWLECTTLARAIQLHTRLAEETAIRTIAQVGQALDYVQQGNLVCRPNLNNIVIRNDGVAKLVTFGPAAGCVPLAPLAGSKTPSPLDLPLPDPADAPVAEPIYCLAVTLYAAVTGQAWAPPVRVEQRPERSRRRAQVRPRIVGLTGRVEAAVGAATAADVAARPKTAAEFLRLLHGRYRTAGTAKGDSRILMPDTENRRTHVRYAVGVGSSGRIHNSVLEADGDGSTSQEIWPLVIRDVSLGGVGLLLARRCEVGTDLMIVMNTGSGRPAKTVSVRVVRVKRENHGHWAHGCMFLDPLSEEDLGGLLDHLTRDGT
jgi:serine/threonine protein kinase